MSKESDKILVEIAAYRDPELLNTVKSAITQADNPKRVFFAICLQSDDIDVLKELKQMNNCRVTYMREKDARGSCYARYLCQKLIEDEKYIYQIDSHMRFVKHWDTKMIEQLESLNDPKASISFYPPHCTKEMMELPFDDEKFDNPCEGGIMCSNGFNKDGSHFMKCNCNAAKLELDKEPALTKNPFISAGNFFAYADIHREVIHDPNMYFYGDELPMAIKYYTHGWNNYNSTICYVYHQYERPDIKWAQKPANYKNEDVRFDELLNLDGQNKDMEQYGLGTVRTLKDFEEFSGLNFRNRTVSMATEQGVYDDQEMKGKTSYLKDRQQQIEKECVREENIEVILIDPYGKYKDSIKNIKETSKNKVHFIVATTKEISSYKDKHIKKLININEDFSYTEVLHELVTYLDDTSYTVVVDSSVIFIEGWDKFYLSDCKKCGPKSILTAWIWYKEDPKEIAAYYNTVKVFDRFEEYMPVLKYNSDIKFSDTAYPHKTPWISDGFIFCKSSTLKRVEIDPTLRYDEHQYLYSLRLFTNGIDIYYPTTSFFIRTKDQNKFNKGDYHKGIISALAGLNNYYSKRVEKGYKYDIGNERPLFDWYKEIGFDFTKDKDYEVY